MEYKHGLHPMVDAESNPETQDTPQDNTAVLPEQEAANGKTNTAQKIIVNIKNAFSAEKWKKSSAILGAAMVVIIAGIILLSQGNAASVAKRYCNGFFGNSKMQAKLTAYDWKEKQLEYYDDEEDFFDSMSDKYDESITSWGSFFKAKDKYYKETLEDLVGKYKITTEVTREKDLSLKKFLDENSSLIRNLDMNGFIDKDSISAAKEFVVKMKIKGEDQTVRNTYDMYLVKIGGAWKVLDFDVDSDYDD